MTSSSTLPFLFAETGTCWLRTVRHSHLSAPKPAPFPMLVSTNPPNPTLRPAYQILLPAVYDRIALAVNIKSKHMGRTEVPGAGEEGQASAKFQTFLLVPRCKNLGHVYLNISSKASSFLPQDGELNETLLCLHSLPSCSWNTHMGPLPPEGEPHRNRVWQLTYSPHMFRGWPRLVLCSMLKVPRQHGLCLFKPNKFPPSFSGVQRVQWLRVTTVMNVWHNTQNRTGAKGRWHLLAYISQGTN